MALTAEQRQQARKLYQQACHGAGAEPRWQARNAIMRLLSETGLSLRELFEELGLDMAAYFASQPIRQ